MDEDHGNLEYPDELCSCRRDIHHLTIPASCAFREKSYDITFLEGCGDTSYRLKIASSLNLRYGAYKMTKKETNALHLKKIATSDPPYRIWIKRRDEERIKCVRMIAEYYCRPFIWNDFLDAFPFHMISSLEIRTICKLEHPESRC